jgi:tetratricopeptide (TPR) repeat protein
METNLTAQELLLRGVQLLDTGHPGDALRNLEQSHAINPDSPRCLSYLGAALAMVEKRIQEGEELCQLAIRREFYQTDFYWNLGRVYLAGGRKDQAVWAFRKGLEMDETHRPMQEALLRLGYRRRPILGFLPRDHFLNRELGKILFHFLAGARIRP